MLLPLVTLRTCLFPVLSIEPELHHIINLCLVLFLLGVSMHFLKHPHQDEEAQGIRGLVGTLSERKQSLKRLIFKGLKAINNKRLD